MVVEAPPSKSYAQRAIACALLADGCSQIVSAGDSGDVRAAIGAAASLGATIEYDGNSARIVGGMRGDAKRVDVGESGLAARLFTPLAALCEREIVVDGGGSLRSRPMGMVFDALRQLGVQLKGDGRLPIAVRGPICGGRLLELDGGMSSQLLTGLLTALPVVAGDTTIVVDDLKSRSYIDITLDVLSRFGVEIQRSDYREFRVRGAQSYRPTRFVVEGDWSGASYFLVAQATGLFDVRVEGLNAESLQPDRAIVDAIEAAKGLVAFSFDATHCPDLFPSLVALAVACDGVSTIKGTSRLIHKESNRAVVLRDEFLKLGIQIDISVDDIMRVKGGEIHQIAPIDPHNDHRIAMAAAVVARDVDIVCREVVGKSYARFWDDLKKVSR